MKGKGKASSEGPFERMRFLTDAKSIYLRAVHESSEFYCKNENEPLYGFKPESYNEKWGFFGQVIVFEEPAPSVCDHVIVNFALGNERYFTTSEFRPMSDHAVLRMTGSLYRLERRSAVRVPLESTIQHDCNIIRRNGETVFISAHILNISHGGMRLRLPLTPKFGGFTVGEKFRAVIHIDRKWRIETDCETRHISVSGHHFFCGVQFSQESDKEKRLLMAMMMELQRAHLSTG